MNPKQLASKGTESGEQKAFFAWCAMAQFQGFKIANNMDAYSSKGLNAILSSSIGERSNPVIALKWIHAIPNGGARDIVTAARMKAEGVKPGIADIFLPIPRLNYFSRHERPECNGYGLYIELKKIKGGTVSEEQKDFAEHCRKNGYHFAVCKGWCEAASVTQSYLTT